MLPGVVIFDSTTDFDGTPMPVSPSPPPIGDVFDGTTEQAGSGGNGNLGSGGTVYIPPPVQPPYVPPDPTNLVLTVSPPMPSGKFKLFNQISLATGGIQPYNFSIVAGAVPAGTSLVTNNGTNGNIAQVQGNPTAEGPYNYTIQVQDSSGTPLTAQATITGTISGVVPGTFTATVATEGTPPSQLPFPNQTDCYFTVPPYNTLTCEVHGGSATGTELATTFGADLSAGPGQTRTTTITVGSTAAPPNDGTGVMPYTLGTGSPEGYIVFTWS